MDCPKIGYFPPYKKGGDNTTNSNCKCLRMMQDSDELDVPKLNDETVRKLEANGLRMTLQRRRIIEILTSSNCKSPKELWIEAKQFVPDLGIATVYRLINRLEQIGVLSKKRNIGMHPVKPVLGVITDVSGKHLSNRKKELTLNDLIHLGLIAKGVLGQNNQIELSLVGDKINVTVTK